MLVGFRFRMVGTLRRESELPGPPDPVPCFEIRLNGFFWYWYGDWKYKKEVVAGWTSHLDSFRHKTSFPTPFDPYNPSPYKKEMPYISIIHPELPASGGEDEFLAKWPEVSAKLQQQPGVLHVSWGQIVSANNVPVTEFKVLQSICKLVDSQSILKYP